jgi:hypothetical protein
MKVTIDGAKYHVWFDYTLGRVPATGNLWAVTQRTTAKLGVESTVRFKDLKDGRTIPVVETLIDAYADCSPEDQFVKARGRKVALTRLVRRMAERDWHTKELRRQFWEAAFAAMPSLRS